MGNFNFTGGSQLTLDSKWRIAMPTRHREVLAATAPGPLTLTKHPEGCLMVLPRPSWENFRDNLAGQGMGDASWKRMFLGNAQDVELDSAGRMLIPPELRSWGGFDNQTEKSVMLVGLSNYFELWDVKRHDAYELETAQKQMPPAIANFII